MKYLKEYIGYNEYYQEVNHNDYIDLYSGGKFIYFDIDNIKDLMRLFKYHLYRVYTRGYTDEDKLEFNDIPIISSDMSLSEQNRILMEGKYSHSIYIFYVRYGYYSITMRNIGDEWYILNLFNEKNSELQFYRCDQIEGLLKLIEDKL